MRAEVKAIHSPDVYDLETYRPDEEDMFSFLLQVMVGPAGKGGGESFDVQVCTPKWLLQTYGTGDIIFGRHHLIVFKYDYLLISEAIVSYCESCTGETWEEVAGKVSRFGKWEFEDYVPM